MKIGQVFSDIQLSLKSGLILNKVGEGKNPGFFQGVLRRLENGAVLIHIYIKGNPIRPTNIYIYYIVDLK